MIAPRAGSWLGAGRAILLGRVLVVIRLFADERGREVLCGMRWGRVEASV